MKITQSQLNKIVKEELTKVKEAAYEPGRAVAEDEFERLNPSGDADGDMQDFWMSELNTALLTAMGDTGVGNTMAPSAFLKALLPVLNAYGVGDQAQKMVDHVQGNQDMYSPNR